MPETVVAPGERVTPSPSPAHEGFRARLVEVLRSHEEIIPPATSPLGRLWTLFSSERSSIEQCVELIKLDPALTARIFRLANSAAFGARASTIGEAVLKIGFSQAKQIAFSAGVFERFSQLRLPNGLETFWIRNLFVARMAERITAAYGTATGSEYLAGLLHDTGWLLLAAFFREELAQIAASPSPMAERELLSFTHAEISGAICARSLLPAPVVAAVVHHHHPLSLAEQKTSRRDSPAFPAVVLALSDKVADFCGLAIPWQKERRCATTQEIRESAEGEWLSQLGDRISYDLLIGQELPKAKEIAEVFLK